MKAIRVSPYAMGLLVGVAASTIGASSCSSNGGAAHGGSATTASSAATGSTGSAGAGGATSSSKGAGAGGTTSSTGTGTGGASTSATGSGGAPASSTGTGAGGTTSSGPTGSGGAGNASSSSAVASSAASTASASGSSSGGGDDGGAVSTDPFDPASCAGAPITFAEAVAKFSPGSSRVDLSTYVLWRRDRTCNSVTGCSPWGPAQQANAAPPIGNLSGGFPLKGTFGLKISGSNVAAFWNDDSCPAPPGYTCADSISFPSPTTSGALTFPDQDSYAYQVYDNLFIPPSPQDEGWPGDYSLTMTSACARLITAEVTSAQIETMQFAALVHF